LFFCSFFFLLCRSTRSRRTPTRTPPRTGTLSPWRSPTARPSLSCVAVRATRRATWSPTPLSDQNSTVRSFSPTLLSFSPLRG
jgi:hypothetical protein